MTKRHDGTPPVRTKVAPRGMGPIAVLEESEREQAKRLLRPGIATWCERVLRGVEHGERNAMNLFGKAVGLVGADVEINVTLLACQELGVASMSEAKSLIGMARNVEGIDEDQAAATAELFLRAFYAKRGKELKIVEAA